MGSVDTADGKENDSDKFGYYARAVAELLAGDDDDDKFDDKKRQNGSVVSISPFDKALGSGFSELKRERLKMLLRQSVTDLKPKIDEMLEPVTNMNKLQMDLRYKKQQQDLVDSPSDITNRGRPPKKRKFASSMSTAYDSTVEYPVNDVANGELNEDLQLLLNNDIEVVEAAMKKHRDGLASTLKNMRFMLEEVLNSVISKCRSMSTPEKRQLKTQIQDLPEDNLVTVAEILKCCSEPEEGKSRDQIFVNFNEADNATLWRLYCYVESVKKEKTRLSAGDSIS